MRTVTASFDGACEPNPGGHIGLGWVVDGVPHHRYIAAKYDHTNNVAEYLALIEILESCSGKPAALTISGDSQLVVDQVNGAAAVSAANLRGLQSRAVDIVARLKRSGWLVTLMWVSRSENAEADAASKLALKEKGIEPARYEPDPGWTDRLGDIGDLLDISAVAVGKLMTNAGLRVGQQPAEVAIRAGLVQTRFNGFGQAIDWHLEGVTAFLRDVAGTEIRAAVGSLSRRKATVEA